MVTSYNITAFSRVEMMIRKSVSEVFSAFINPDITTKFWFSKSTGRLIQGKIVVWTWEMFNHSSTILVKTIVPNKTIEIDWGDEVSRTTVEWTFKVLSKTMTLVIISNSGFTGDPDQIISKIKDSTEGFTLVLAGLKAYLEHNIQLNLIADRFPGEASTER